MSAHQNPAASQASSPDQEAEQWPAPQAEQDLRREAEQSLRALAGPGARLREDQWTAIRALVSDRRRRLVRHGR